MPPTIRDVARRAHVSEATVSRALRGLRHVSPDTVQQVRRAADELGFTPSRSAAALATGRPRTVAVVTPGLTSWFYAAVVEGVDDVLRTEGYAVSIVNLLGADRVRRRLTARALQDGQAAAHVVIGFDMDEAEQRVLREAAAPVVTVGGTVDGVRGIGIPEAEAARLAVEHLLALGHRRIAHVGADRDDGLNPSVTAARRLAWTAALEAAGVHPEPWWFASGLFRLDASRDAALQLLRRPDRPTAVFAASDVSAFGVLEAARELGLRVPHDLSVTGIDDHPFSAAYRLTTVRQWPAEQGVRAASVLLRDLGVRRRGVPFGPAPVELVVRGSTEALGVSTAGAAHADPRGNGAAGI